MAADPQPPSYLKTVAMLGALLFLVGLSPVAFGLHVLIVRCVDRKTKKEAA